MDEFVALVKPYKSVSVVGMCKNAGKTTALNALISGYQDEIIGLTSVGRDGESFDVVSSNPKPKIFVTTGMIIATADSLLPLCTVTRRIIFSTGISTALGEVIIFECLSDGYVQLAGPSIVSQLKEIIDLLMDCGADKVLLDGALSRKSLCSVTDACIMSTGAVMHRDMDEVVSQTELACKLFSLKKGKGRVIEGALTSSIIKTAKNKETLQVKDAGKILCEKKDLELFFGMGGKLCVENELKLIAVTYNPVSHEGYSFDEKKFEAALKQRIKLPIFNAWKGETP